MNLHKYLSSWELVCVFKLLCLTVGNSHWLRNNYPSDLNIIQLISFISQVITHNRVHFPCSYRRHKASLENTTAAGFRFFSIPGDTFPWESQSAFFHSFEMIYESVVKPYFVYQNVRCKAGWQKQKQMLNLHVCLSPSCISLSQCFLPASHRSGDWICRDGECASHIRFTCDLCLTICHNPISADMTSLIYIWSTCCWCQEPKKSHNSENNGSQASVTEFTPAPPLKSAFTFNSVIYHVP